jgi:hypothetical protein
MGSLHLPRLTVPDLVRLYVEGGQSLFVIGLRAGMPVYRVRSILVEAGVQLRSQVEVIRLSNLAKADTHQRRKRRLQSGR